MNLPHDWLIQACLVFQASAFRAREDNRIQPLWINQLISMQHSSLKSHFREALEHWVKEHKGSWDRIDLITFFLFHTEATYFSCSGKDWHCTWESLSSRVETSSLRGPRWLPSPFHHYVPTAIGAAQFTAFIKIRLDAPIWGCELKPTVLCGEQVRISSLEWNDSSHHCHRMSPLNDWG